MTKKLWGGRFKKEIHPALKAFSYSLEVDHELLDAELRVNEAWVKMLAKVKLLSQTESNKLVRALKGLKKELSSQDIRKAALHFEDVHSWIQGSLEKNIGPLAKKLHTGRSRNDLVVTSTKIYLREKAGQLIGGLSACQRSLIKLAEKSGNAIVAGMTHLRMAQPVLLAHHLLAYVEMLEDDKARLRDVQKRLDVLPLGSAALAGSSLPIDQKFLAKKLKFSKVTTNSLAAVSDRAFLAEFMGALAVLWMHLSRLSEDFILWNSEAFHYVELDDAFATGSSLMPQKKNPDVFELIRGRSGVIFGQLQALLTMQKGLPLAYNRDLQEDKPGVFDAVRKTGLALDVLSKTLETCSFHPESMDLSVQEDVLYATDILEYLVWKGVAFSEAHETVGKIVHYAAENERPLRDVPLEQWKKFNPLFDEHVFDLFDAGKSARAKKTIGSTNPSYVKSQMVRWKQSLKKKNPSNK